MAAGNVYNPEYYSSATSAVPLANQPRLHQDGLVVSHFSVTVATTSTDDADDYVYLMVVPAGVTYTTFMSNCEDLDTGTPALVGALKFINPDDDVETSFSAYSPSAAITNNLLVPAAVRLADNTAGYYHFVLRVTTPSATPAAGAFRGTLLGNKGLR